MIAGVTQSAQATSPEAAFQLFVRGTDIAGEKFEETAALDDRNSEEFYMMIRHQVERGQELNISISFTFKDGSRRAVRETATVSRVDMLGDGTWGVAFRVAP